MMTLKSLISFSNPRDDMFVENRKENEDSFLPVTHKNGGYLFSMADGVGSYPGALDASSFVCDFLLSNEKISHDYLDRKFERDLSSSFIEYFSNKDPKYRKAATTLSFCFLDDKGLSIWHAGDSRIYIQQGMKLIQVTTDHTQYQKLLDEKIYTKKELKEKNISRNTLLTAVSMAIELKSDYHFIPMDKLKLEYGEDITIIIMSDGAHHFWDLRKRFSTKTMEDIVKFSSALKRRIERFGAIDDYTVVAATFNVRDRLKVQGTTTLPIQE